MLWHLTVDAVISISRIMFWYCSNEWEQLGTLFDFIKYEWLSLWKIKLDAFPNIAYDLYY